MRLWMQDRTHTCGNRLTACAATEFESVPLFDDATSFGPKAGSMSSTKSTESAEDKLRAVELKSGRNVDYEPLRQALLEKDFFKADDIHRKKLIEVAGEPAQERGWVYFSEVKDIPVEDLQTIDQLWVASSNGKFGFSVQRQIWRACDMKWSKFFQAINWLKGEKLNYRAWPAEFIYDLEATKGHLPLTNALRGTQLFECIMTHPAFESKEKPAWSDQQPFLSCLTGFCLVIEAS
eukprot:TRINITY_DN286_c0_g4_i1.p1 TRINITY_DN286_c0_g4~~TRINITY_DN286_c0_g4_i1.p1  ORF type:complete len:235 (-),score=12.83 TRINITY_DN286_c0_g4_i1:104-808(-)